MREAALVQDIRQGAGLSLRALAEAAGVATSTVHRIEQGRLHPTMEMLQTIAEAAGVRLEVVPAVDHAVSVTGLARSMRDDLERDDTTTVVRKAAELVRRFQGAEQARRRRMLAAEPPATGDRRWDAFLAALAEWLAVRAGLPAPAWVHEPGRYVGGGWWVTPMKSLRAWEYAGSPASFQVHGVYLHRDSLINV